MNRPEGNDNDNGRGARRITKITRVSSDEETSGSDSELKNRNNGRGRGSVRGRGSARVAEIDSSDEETSGSDSGSELKNRNSGRGRACTIVRGNGVVRVSVRGRANGRGGISYGRGSGDSRGRSCSRARGRSNVRYVETDSSDEESSEEDEMMNTNSDITKRRVVRTDSSNEENSKHLIESSDEEEETNGYVEESEEDEVVYVDESEDLDESIEEDCSYHSSDDEIEHAEGCPGIDPENYFKLLKFDMDTLIYRKHNKAASEGDLVTLMRLHQETGSPGTEITCSGAASKGHLHIVKYLHFNGVPLEINTIIKSCESNNVELLKYIQENGCKWNVNCLSVAIKKGHLEVVNYLLDNQVPKSISALHLACKYGNLEMVRSLHTHGYEIDHTHVYAAISGYDQETGKQTDEKVSLELTKYLLSICTIKSCMYFRTAINTCRTKIAKWLFENGYPAVFIPSEVSECEYLQHKLGIMTCLEKGGDQDCNSDGIYQRDLGQEGGGGREIAKKCKYCNIDRIKICRRDLYAKEGYGTWLSSDIIETMIHNIYKYQIVEE